MKVLFYILLMTLSIQLFSQGVAINNNGSSPNSNTVLDIDDTGNDKGILIPRITTAQRTGIAGLGAGDEGLTVYDETTNCYWLWDGAAWVQFLSSTSGWKLTGNTGTTVGTNFLGTTDNQDFAIYTNNAEVIRVQADGDVGINKTNPLYKLHVGGTFKNEGFAYLGSANLASTRPVAGNEVAISWNYSNGNREMSFWNTDPTAGATDVAFSFKQLSTAGAAHLDIMTLMAQGNVGIGIASPSSKLHVYSTGSKAVYGQLNAAGINYAGYFTTTSGTGYGIYASGGTAAKLEGTVYGLYSMAPTAGYFNGNSYGVYAQSVGIAGYFKYDVSNFANIAQDGIGVEASGSDYAGKFVGGTYGVYGEGTSYAGYFNGNLCYSGTLGACSDKRYKKNIDKIENAIELINNIEGVRYDWKTEDFPNKNFSTKKQIGFIAQDIEKTLPELVFTDEEGYKSVDYAKLVSVLTEAVKELNLKIEKLEKEVISQKNIISSSNSKIE